MVFMILKIMSTKILPIIHFCYVVLQQHQVVIIYRQGIFLIYLKFFHFQKVENKKVITSTCYLINA